MKKQIKYETKVQLEPMPPPIDSIRLEKLAIDLKRGTVKIDIQLIDSEAKGGKGAVTERRPIHMGLADLEKRGVNIDKLEKETLDAVLATDILPDGGKIE